eukprot:1791683-Alexandrium_andersonii.AAC.1
MGGPIWAPLVRRGASLLEKSQQVAENCFQEPEVKPRKQWVSQDTVALIQGRARLIQAGNWPALEGQNSLIKKAARKDRIAWVENDPGI